MQRLFITGTDTDVGKTYVSRLLLKGFNQQAYRTVAIKPVAAGCEKNKTGQWRNHDALLLQQGASVFLPYHDVNPITLAEPIAPHIAATSEGKSSIVNLTFQAMARDWPADIALIEGAGGWLVPLDSKTFFYQLVLELAIPVILVVGMRLGCLNHALLSYQHIKSCGGTCLGWIANCLDPNMQALSENIASLTGRIGAPCLAVVPYQSVQPVFLPFKLASPDDRVMVCPDSSCNLR